jgi:hypothetical protein
MAGVETGWKRDQSHRPYRALGAETGAADFFTPNGRNPLKSLDSKK